MKLSIIMYRIGRRAFRKIPPCSAVIAAGGSSKRMGSVGDKLFIPICDTPMIVHTMRAFQNCKHINEIIVVAREEIIDSIAELCSQYDISKVAMIVCGGPTRVESVLNGVLAISKKAGLVAIHDGARPCVDSDIIIKTIAKASKYHAAAPGVKVTSTLKSVKKGFIKKTVPREGLVEIQTPQVFDVDLIKAALTKAVQDSSDITDDCMALELMGFPVYVTEGRADNIKITTKEDIAIAEAILAVNN